MRGSWDPEKINANEMEDVLKETPRKKILRGPRLGRKEAQAEAREG